MLASQSSPPLALQTNICYTNSCGETRNHHTTYQTPTKLATMATSTSTPPKPRSPLTQATLTPPALNRQPTHHAHTSATADNDATTVLTRLRPKVDSRSSSSSPPKTGSVSSSPSPSPSGSPARAEGRVSWEDCVGKEREGYVSFPDFDRLVAGVGGKCGVSR